MQLQWWNGIIHKESAECNELPSVQCSCACLKVLIYTIRTTNSPSGQHISIKEFIYLIATYMLKNTSTEFARFFLLKKPKFKHFGSLYKLSNIIGNI